MATEIADSDAESDVLDAQDASLEPSGDGPIHTFPPGVDFDDLLKPTQVLSDQSLAAETPCGRGTGRTADELCGLDRTQQDVGRMGDDMVVGLCQPAVDLDQGHAGQIAAIQAGHNAEEQRAGPGRGIDLLGSTSTFSNIGYPAKTVSSYGGYQSIELDFRHGLDHDINPFEAMSQASADGAGAGAGAGAEGMAGDGGPTGDVNEREHVEALPHSKRRKTDDFSRDMTTSPGSSIRRTASASVEPVSAIPGNAQPKKRGRKPKAKQVAVSAAPDEMGPPDTPAAASRPRPGALDSSQLSQEEMPSNTKRKRQKSQVDAKAEETSPAKGPSSELLPDEDELVGLPKERYKPRPSRRRSKALVVDEPTEDHAKTHDAEAALEDNGQPEARLPSPKPSKKKKKSKIQRGKTSAAALLKKSCPMYSDGEDDVIWSYEKPAAVKLELPPDLTKLKKEADTETEPGGEAKTAAQTEAVCVDIPVTGSREQRGEPDSALDKAPTPEPLSGDEAEDTAAQQKTEKHVDMDDKQQPSADPGNARRPPLATKDANSRPVVAPAASPPQPVAVLPGKETERQAEGEDNKENAATPSPKKPAKGPTTHSPIAPASAWNSKSRFRVGLSKRQSIPSLLRKVDKTKAAPTKVGVRTQERRVKEVHVGGGEDGGEEDHSRGGGLILRDKDGNLVEWEF